MMIAKQRLLLLISVIEFSLCTNIDLCSNDRGSVTVYRTKAIVNCNCDPSSCIRKCCKNGFTFFSTYGICRATNKTLIKSVNFYYVDNKIVNLTTEDGFRVGMLNCTPPLHGNANTYLYQNGSYKIGQDVISFKEYCINRDINTLNYYHCTEVRMKEGVDEELKQELTCIGEIISVPFLVATFVIYAFLSERNIQRNALMLHSLSLISHNILFALQNYTNVIQNYNLCQISGLLRLYFRSAAYFWVNVMCFDVWLAFRGVSGIREQSNKKIIHLIIVNIYAWGMPSIFVLMVFLGEGISEKSCFLKVSEYLTFNVGSGMILLLFNIILFVLTTRNIQRIKKGITGVTGSNSTRINELVEQFTLYWSLIFVVGYSTLFNVHLIHLAIVLAASGGDYSFTFLNFYSGFVNGTYGIGIFIIYVCRKRMREAVKNRYYQITGKRIKNDISSAGNTTSSNAQ